MGEIIVTDIDMRYALVFPLSAIIEGHGDDAVLKRGARRLMNWMAQERLPCGVIVDEPIREGKITVTRVRRLLNRANPFRVVVYKTCRDPLSVAQDYFAHKDMEVVFTFWPMGMGTCKCGRFVFPRDVYFYRRKEKKTYLCACGEEWEE